MSAYQVIRWTKAYKYSCQSAALKPAAPPDDACRPKLLNIPFKLLRVITRAGSEVGPGPLE